MESKVLEELAAREEAANFDKVTEEKDKSVEKVEKKHLSNEQVEATEWELLAIYVRYLHSKGGVVECSFAYRDNIEDTFKIITKADNTTEIRLEKVYPGRIKRSIESRIKEHNPDKKSVKRTTITRTPKDKPTIMIINRNK